MNVLRPTESGKFELSRFELNASDMIHSAMQEWSEMKEKL
jgi:hypothetical protein